MNLVFLMLYLFWIRAFKRHAKLVGRGGLANNLKLLIWMKPHILNLDENPHPQFGCKPKSSIWMQTHIVNLD
jgi:hypothetical protein